MGTKKLHSISEVKFSRSSTPFDKDPKFPAMMGITENLVALIYQLLHLAKKICFRGLSPRLFVQP